MPIEIRQLVIRAVVEARPAGAAPDGRAAGPRAPAPAGEGEGRAPAAEPVDREALIAACVREVLRELRRARER